MRRLLGYYGDDFTGSTDVMEALAINGIETVLFTRIPSPAEFLPFVKYQAVGLAGTSRSEAPEWMDEHLPGAFFWLKSLTPRFYHYKVCSTFDSSPRVGSIGRAVDVGTRVFGQQVPSLIIGAPQLKRFTFAGHLFAAYQGVIHRIDRHPVMSRHPVTPMDESDVLVHLARQTGTIVRLLDVYDGETQRAAGEALLGLEKEGGLFVVGSSGVEYALLAALRSRGQLAEPGQFASIARLSQLAVVSGSVSPTTERQIRRALASGFVSVPVDPIALAHADDSALGTAVEVALRVLSTGGSPIVHTALGPASDNGLALDGIVDARRYVGEGLGRILRHILDRTHIRRAVIAGGDSSSHALQQLDIFALTMRMPLPATPGSPLCRSVSAIASLDGIEIALKGGQVGSDTYFRDLRDGTV